MSYGLAYHHRPGLDFEAIQRMLTEAADQAGGAADAFRASRALSSALHATWWTLSDPDGIS